MDVERDFLTRATIYLSVRINHGARLGADLSFEALWVIAACCVSAWSFDADALCAPGSLHINA